MLFFLDKITMTKVSLKYLLLNIIICLIKHNKAFEYIFLTRYKFIPCKDTHIRC